MTDARLAILIFVLAAIAGWLYMTLCIGVTGPQYDIEGEMMLPAIMWASGHGLSSTVYPLFPALNAFVEQRTLHLAREDVPKWIPARSVMGDKFANDRIYLFYAVGLTWRLLGISWTSLNVFIALVYAIMAVLIYAIFRLGIGRLFSVLGVLLAMSSPLMLRLLPSIRDLCKGPFILATILAVAFLLSRPIRLRSFLALSIVLGVVIGIGVGFRQDAIICVPPALGAIAFLAHGTHRLRPTVRIVGVVLFIIAFLIPAWPTLRMTRDTGGNNSFYLLQGFSLSSQESLGMRRASYAPLANFSDAVVHANVCIFDRTYPTPRTDFWAEQWRAASSRFFLQGLVNLTVDPVSAVAPFAVDVLLSKDELFLGIWSKDAEEAARRFVRSLAATFPADVISRWYAATTHVFHGVQDAPTEDTAYNAVLRAMYAIHTPLQNHLAKYGDFYALAALLVIAARNPWLAFAALGLVVYFCGYTGLSFQSRHAFHLEFIGFWMPAFCLDLAIRTGATLRKPEERRLLLSRAASLQVWAPHLKRCVIFLAGSIVLLSLPLVPARMFQHRQVDALLRHYRDCRLETVPFEEKTDGDGTSYYHPIGTLEFAQTERARWWWKLAGVPTERIPGLLADYLVADVEVQPNQYSANVRALYDDPLHRLDTTDTFNVDSRSDCVSFRYFFPVYRYVFIDPPIPFKGIATTPQLRLKNLYRVRNPWDFPLWMNFWLPDDSAPVQWYQAIPIFGDWL